MSSERIGIVAGQTAKASWTTVGHVERADLRGGPSQQDIRAFVESLGLRVRFERSMYVGHYCVSVNTRDRRRVARVQRFVGLA